MSDRNLDGYLAKELGYGVHFRCFSCCQENPSLALTSEPVPRYSSKISAAWELVEKLGLSIQPTGNGPKGVPAGYWVGIPGAHSLVGDIENPTVAFAEQAPMAIALSAKKYLKNALS